MVCCPTYSCTTSLFCCRICRHTMVVCICHLIFSATTHYFFKKYCVVRHVRNTIFFEKNNVLWQVCHNTLLFESQHVIFFKKNIVLLRHVRNTIFLTIMCCGKKIRWQIHATISYYTLYKPTAHDK